MNGISAKVLSKELKDLEAHRLISREVQETKPVTVAYAITKYGKTTNDLINILVEWGRNHRIQLLSDELK